jgi:hypothetical protein
MSSWSGGRFIITFLHRVQRPKPSIGEMDAAMLLTGTSICFSTVQRTLMPGARLDDLIPLIIEPDATAS